MWKELLAYILPLIAWGALSGVLNLILTRKSQIEAWVNVHPRLAAWSKLLRSVGFDPWAAHAWLTLLVKKKLPEAQQANSPVAKLEQRKADAKKLHVDDDLPPPPPSRWVPPAMLLCLLLVVACSSGSPSPTCTDAAYRDQLAACGLAAVKCVDNGGNGDECGHVCDKEWADWQERCSQ